MGGRPAGSTGVYKRRSTRQEARRIVRTAAALRRHDPRSAIRSERVERSSLATPTAPQRRCPTCPAAHPFAGLLLQQWSCRGYGDHGRAAVEVSRTTLEASRQSRTSMRPPTGLDQNSRQGVVTAQNTLDSVAPTALLHRPARALVANNEACPAGPRDVDDATLRPIGGTVRRSRHVGELSASPAPPRWPPAATRRSPAPTRPPTPAHPGSRPPPGPAARNSWSSTTSTGCRWYSRSRSPTHPRSSPTRT